MEIPEIKTNDIRITDIEIRDINIPQIINVFDRSSVSIPSAPPVVLEVGLPIVDVPGCVKAHEKSDKNDKLLDDDPKGTKTFCDGQTPSFEPIQYEPERLVPTNPANIPKTDTPDKPEPKVPETPKIPEKLPTTPNVECPTKEQMRDEPVGFIFDSGRKEIVGYELVGLECKRIVEDVPIPAQIINAIPPASTITTTASIAVVATTSALLAKPFADILLRVVKPVTKKVIKKIASIRGKKVKVLSINERRLEQRDRNDAISTLKKTLKPK
tara:strand:- start:2551 stop:3360 length:810 start_codon:yes stop_codon:yes gene_type:complete